MAGMGIRSEKAIFINKRLDGFRKCVVGLVDRKILVIIDKPGYHLFIFFRLQTAYNILQDPTNFYHGCQCLQKRGLPVLIVCKIHF